MPHAILTDKQGLGSYGKTVGEKWGGAGHIRAVHWLTMGATGYIYIYIYVYIYTRQ